MIVLVVVVIPTTNTGFGRNSQLSKWEKRKRGRDRAVPIKHSPRKRKLGRYLGLDKYKGQYGEFKT